MFKILIVDDEPDICELIHKLINWNDLDAISLGAVQNGQDAMQVILRQKPDVVITDIQMPGMTGLDIIEQVRRDNLPIDFIVISGYSEFEYAQRAIHFNVKDYLLKPINKTDLNLILRRLASEKQLSNASSEQEKDLRDTLDQRTRVLRGNQMRQTLADPSRTDFDVRLFNFCPGEFLAITIHASFRDKASIDTESLSNILTSIALRVENKLRDDCHDLEYTINDCNAVILMNYDLNTQISYRERKKAIQQILDECSIQYESLKISFALGKPSTNAAHIPQVLETSEIASRLRIVAGCSNVLEYLSLENSLSDSIKCTISFESLRTLSQMISSFNENGATSYIAQIFSSFRNSRSFDLNRLFNVTIEAMYYLDNEISIPGLDINGADTVEQKPTRAAISIGMANCDTVDEIEDCFRENVLALLHYYKSIQQMQITRPIIAVQEYIAKNLDRQISLEEAAEQVFISAGYLSALFKEQTGKGFSDYVIEARINEAKRLLRNAGYSLSEIASMVGYADPKHFSKVFQKVVGMKPSEYRKFYR